MIQNDFDFILGKWTVHNRRLKERLTNCKEWISFEADYESRHILGGMGNMDEIWTDHFGDRFHGMSIRLYNPDTKKWTIFWSDNMHPKSGVKEQVKGIFKNGDGLFYGEEIYNGQPVKLRFIWKSISPTEAYWEQAYFDDRVGKWETNWIMEFQKK